MHVHYTLWSITLCNSWFSLIQNTDSRDHSETQQSNLGTHSAGCSTYRDDVMSAPSLGPPSTRDRSENTDITVIRLNICDTQKQPLLGSSAASSATSSADENNDA